MRQLVERRPALVGVQQLERSLERRSTGGSRERLGLVQQGTERGLGSLEQRSYVLGKRLGSLGIGLERLEPQVGLERVLKLGVRRRVRYRVPLLEQRHERAPALVLELAQMQLEQRALLVVAQVLALEPLSAAQHLLRRLPAAVHVLDLLAIQHQQLVLGLLSAHVFATSIELATLLVSCSINLTTSLRQSERRRCVRIAK